jgi:NAD(P)H-quinone oxidoreductase subunit I
LKFERYGIGIAKGLRVTVRHLLRRPVTTQYPEQRLSTSRRIRGNELIWSREKCTGCGTCAKACHIGAIKIITTTNPVANKYEVETYQVDTGYCIQCGLCVEVCPFGALYMGYAYERARYRRNDLIQDKETMMETPDREVSGYFYPERAAKLPRQTLLLDRDKGRK